MAYQAEDLLTSSQLLLAKNEYVQAADAVASAEVLLGDLQQADAASGAERGPLGGAVVDKENRRNAATGTGRVMGPYPLIHEVDSNACAVKRLR